jgi:tRNA(Arg) A34 adenosine deaminase TadA
VATTNQPYSFDGNDPVNNSDPTGRSFWGALDSGLNWFNININPGYQALVDFSDGDYAGGVFQIGMLALAATGIEQLGSLGLRAVGLIGGRSAADVAAQESARLATRVGDLNSVLDPIAQNSRTVAVLSTQEGGDILAAGGRDLSPLQRELAQEGDILARAPGVHAEITALQAAEEAGLTPSEMAVSRTICTPCQIAIEESGGTVGPNGLTAVWT